MRRRWKAVSESGYSHQLPIHDPCGGERAIRPYPFLGEYLDGFEKSAY